MQYFIHKTSKVANLLCMKINSWVLFKLIRYLQKWIIINFQGYKFTPDPYKILVVMNIYIFQSQILSNNIQRQNERHPSIHRMLNMYDKDRLVQYYTDLEVNKSKEWNWTWYTIAIMILQKILINQSPSQWYTVSHAEIRKG